ncbi:hypothetical protein GF386_04335 [Candidatus Pacearchaeota archaeon]|nr:hypothetical protein [Candidatus Pacearchaeota archaeon]
MSYELTETNGVFEYIDETRILRFSRQDFVRLEIPRLAGNIPDICSYHGYIITRNIVLAIGSERVIRLPLSREGKPVRTRNMSDLLPEDYFLYSDFCSRDR